MTSRRLTSSIRFRGFWPGFDPYAFFIPFVSHALGHPVVLSDAPRVDLELVSVFPERRRPGPIGTLRERYAHRLPAGLRGRPYDSTPEPSSLARVSIWYSGENIRPPIGEWDATWSFDTDSYGGINSYLPLWMIGMDFPWRTGGLGRPQMTEAPTDDANFLGRRLRTQEMRSPRLGGAGERTRFCCTFINHPEPVRMRAIQALHELGQVDVFGRVSGRRVADKMSVAKDYRFILCFENDVYPGYVTEKPIEAWATGAVPIWRGWDPARYLNPRALINHLDYRDTAQLTQAVAELHDDPDEMNRISGLPILTREPELDPVARQLRELLLD